MEKSRLYALLMKALAEDSWYFVGIVYSGIGLNGASWGYYRSPKYGNIYFDIDVGTYNRAFVYVNGKEVMSFNYMWWNPFCKLNKAVIGMRKRMRENEKNKKLDLINKELDSYFIGDERRNVQ